MTAYYSVSCPQEEFIRLPQIYGFITGHFPNETAIICSENMYSVLLSLKIKSDIFEINSDKAAELIEKSDRYDSTVILGDDIPRLISKIDKLYFFADSAENIWECWNNFKCTDEFIHSDHGSVKCGDKDMGYIYLEHLSSGNSILYNELSRMIKEHKLTEQALSGAEKNVKNFINEEPQEAERQGFLPFEDLHFHVDRCHYAIRDPAAYKDEWIAVEIEMRNSRTVIGYYTMIFDSGNGVITDDIFYSPF